MRFWTAYAVLALGLVSKVYGAAGEGHGSISDLIAPTINVAILLGVLIWKIKGPMKNVFIAKSEEVSNTLERASLKSKEARLMLENEQRKQAHLATEISSIHQQGENDVTAFEKNLAREIEDKSHKLKIDANAKIAAEKKGLMDELNAELLDQVIKQTKETIKTNKDYQSKASTKLLQGI